MFRKLIPAALVTASAFATLVTDVETAMSRGNFQMAEAMLQSYRSQRGVTPEYLEALSWLARGDLITRQFDRADAVAKETEKLAVQSLATRPLDAEPHLPLALGAADLSLIEHTSAFTVFPDDGIHIEPHYIRRVTSYDGAVLEEPRPKVTDVIPRDVEGSAPTIVSMALSESPGAVVTPHIWRGIIAAPR